MPKSRKSSPAHRKERITVYVSPYLYKEIQELINSGDFSSESDVGYQALSKFIDEYRKRKGEK